MPARSAYQNDEEPPENQAVNLHRFMNDQITIMVMTGGIHQEKSSFTMAASSVVVDGILIPGVNKENKKDR